MKGEEIIKIKMKSNVLSISFFLIKITISNSVKFDRKIVAIQRLVTTTCLLKIKSNNVYF